MVLLMISLILCKINLAIVFVCVRSTTSDYCIKIHVQITGEGIPVKKIKIVSTLSENGVSNRIFFNHVCVYSCLVPTNMLTNISERNSWRLQSISQTSKSNVIIISQSRCTTLQQLNNLIHHEVVYNLSPLFSFGI